MTVLMQIVNVIFLKLWGKFTDRFSNKSVLAICCPFFLLSILDWTIKYTRPSREVVLPTLNLRQWDFFSPSPLSWGSTPCTVWR